MSLILDALRKLEREKAAKEPGVVVVGSVPWGERSRSRRVLLAAGAGSALALVVVVFWLLRPAREAAVPPPGAKASPPAVVAESPMPLPPVTLHAPTPTPHAAPEIRLGRPVSRPAARGASVPSAPGPDRPVAPSPDQAPPAEPVRAAEPPAEPADAAGAAELRLNAISQRDGRPVALINDRLVFEGDSFDGIRVLRIGEAEVELEVHGEKRVLRF